MDVSQEQSMLYAGASRYIAQSDKGEVIDFSSKQGLYSVWLNGIPLSCSPRIVREAAERYGTLARFFAKPSATTDGVYFVKLHYLSKSSAVAAAAGLNDSKPWLARPDAGVDENTPGIKAKRSHAVHEDFDYEEQVKQPNSLKKESLVAQLNTYLSPFGWSNSIDVIDVYSKCAKLSARDKQAEAPRLPHVEQLEALRQIILAEAQSCAPTVPSLASNLASSRDTGGNIPVLLAPTRVPALGIHAVTEPAHALPAPPPTHAPAMTDEQIADVLASYKPGALHHFSGPGGYGSLFEELGISTGSQAKGRKKRNRQNQGEEEPAGQEHTDDEQEAVIESDHLDTSEVDAMLAELEEAHVQEEEARLMELAEGQQASDEALLARQRAIAEGIRRQMMVPDAQGLTRVHKVRDTALPKVSTLQHFSRQSAQAEYPSLSALKAAAVLSVYAKDGHATASVSSVSDSLPVKAPCVFVRQMLHIHNRDGTTLTSVAAGGCGCRHGADGLDANLAFTSRPAEMQPVFASGGAACAHASRSGWRAGSVPFRLGTATAVLAAEPPSEMAQQPALPMSQQLSQSPGDSLGATSTLMGGGKALSGAGLVLPGIHGEGQTKGKRRKKSVLRKAEFTAGKVASGAPAKLVVDESLRFAANAVQIWIPTREAMHGFKAVING